jgi:hypothetical protein
MSQFEGRRHRLQLRLAGAEHDRPPGPVEKRCQRLQDEVYSLLVFQSADEGEKRRLVLAFEAELSQERGFVLRPPVEALGVEAGDKRPVGRRIPDRPGRCRSGCRPAGLVDRRIASRPKPNSGVVISRA